MYRYRITKAIFCQNEASFSTSWYVRSYSYNIIIVVLLYEQNNNNNNLPVAGMYIQIIKQSHKQRPLLHHHLPLYLLLPLHQLQVRASCDCCNMASYTSTLLSINIHVVLTIHCFELTAIYVHWNLIVLLRRSNQSRSLCYCIVIVHLMHN